MANTKSISSNQQVAITISLPNPAVIFSNTIKKAKVLFARQENIFLSRLTLARKLEKMLFSVIYNPLRKSVIQSTSFAGEVMKKSSFSEKFKAFRKLNRKKLFKMVFPIVLIVIVLGVAIAIVKNLPDAQSTPTAISNSSSTEIKVASALATQNLDKQMQFPLKDANGKEVGKFEYTIQNAEVRKQIVVQGRNATAVSGRVFLIFNLKLKNNLDKALQLNTRDYIRISVASNPSEKLAADIHNDPVEVQAISTKYTRVGLALEEKDAHQPIEITVGEIGGAKQTVTLNFKFR